MKKLKKWQFISLIIFYPIGIIYFLVWIIYKCTSAKKKPATSYTNTQSTNNINNQMHTVPKESNTENNYEYIKFNVAGVTFKNGSQSRQTLLRKIKFRDPPFDTNNNYIELSTYEYEGEDAIAVNVNNLQIGNVPKDNVKYLIDNWDRIDRPTALDIIGGGTDSEGNKLNYGATLYIRLNK